MFCHNCLNADYDVVNGIGKITNCPICNSKRIEIRKLGRIGLDKKFIKMFLRLLEYIDEI